MGMFSDNNSVGLLLTSDLCLGWPTGLVVSDVERIIKNATTIRKDVSVHGFS